MAEGNGDSRLDRLEQLIISRTTNLEALLVQMKESLEREIRTGLDRLDTRFNEQAARLDRQGGLLNAGSRWSTRMDEWSERIDRALEKKDQQIAELMKRIERLEAAQPPRPPQEAD